MDLDCDTVPHNTPESRTALVNAPAWTDRLSFSTFPHPVPPGLLDWVEARRDRARGVREGRLGATRAPSAIRAQGPRAERDPRGASVVLWGTVGSGKTGLGSCALASLAALGAGSTFYWNMATGAGVAAAIAAGDLKRRPSPCWFESWSRLLSLYRRERFDEEGWFDQLEERVSVLMLDDVGVDTGTPFRESFLLRHVEWAADRAGRSLILTINAPPSEWLGALGARVADRLVDPARFSVVEVAGPSLR